MCDLGGGACEMKRMFVKPDFWRLGVGSALAPSIIAGARQAGFRKMRLDTSIRQVQAMALYERMGFRSTEPDRDLPRDIRDWLVFFELLL
jgi:GNAT superfamily N-acetyltransferase